MFDEYYGGTSTNASQLHSAAPAQNHQPPPPSQDAISLLLPQIICSPSICALVYKRV